MPGYKQHLTFGGIVGVVLLTVLPWVDKGSLFFCLRSLIFCFLGSLFPDVDTKSKGQLLFYRLALFSYLFLVISGQWVSSSLLGLCALLPLVVHHRGIFHRSWFIALITAGVALLCCWWVPHEQFRICIDALFFLAGAWSHLYLDVGVRRMFRF